MLIRNDHLEGIATGRITIAFRKWQSPAVKTGGTLRTTIGVLAIDSVERVRDRDLTLAQAIAAGYPSREVLLAELARRTVGDVYRIRLHVSGPDPRARLREQSSISTTERDRLREALQAIDRRSRNGPWTQTLLDELAKRETCRAGELAAVLGLEKEWLKVNIRKLKELGLTQSLASGYRLSPRGTALHALLQGPTRA
jgi:hypothetical protein